MATLEQAGADAVGVLLNTVVEDSHLEHDPQIAPSTSADEQPVLVRKSEGGSLPSELPVEQAIRKPATMNGQTLPDLRHEQTYLAALARTNGSYLAIARVTMIDFLLWPTLTQFAYVLGLSAFKYLRTGSTRSGRKFGELIRDFLNVGGVLD